MFAFVTTVGNLLKMDLGERPNFNQNKREMRIPLYQREYKWSDEKITGMIQDINSRDKFLGNIIFDELSDHYEIADGQQRITTCLLILVALYNHYEGSPIEQSSIKSFITPINQQLILKNESIGVFIAENNNKLSLSINESNDCYKQKEDFERAYNVVLSNLNKIAEQGDIRTFKNKLLDCKFLVLINDQHTNSNPIEQIFLDINEKAMLLEPEDIFKGHCFEKFSDANYNDLRNTWVDLKIQAVLFRQFGFKDLSEYIYLFILEAEDINVSKNLTLNGKHYLDDKTMDEIANILENMINYGKAVTKISSNIDSDSYRLIDVCPNASNYQNTQDHFILKRMLRNMFLNSNAKYQKLPVFYLIFKLYYDEELRKTIPYDAFKRIVTNLYIYNYVFAYLGGQKKSKKLIDHSIKDSLCSSDRTLQKIIDAAKALRNNELESIDLRDGNKRPGIYLVFSVIDFYDAQDNWMKNIYYESSGCLFNIEHFIIPNHKKKIVKWISNTNSFEIKLSREMVSKNKKILANFVIINRTLNEQMGHNDIVEKIVMIQEWFSARKQPVPKHIQLYIDHISTSTGYNKLKELKANGDGEEVIKQAYIDFLDEYFSDDMQNKLYSSLNSAFKAAFTN